MKCPICDSQGSLHEKIVTIKARPLPSVSIDVPLHFFHCNACGEEIELSHQLSANDRAIKHAKLRWLAEHIEKPDCVPTLIKDLRSLFGVSQKEFSDVIGATGNSISKYELGTISPSSMAKKLLKLIALNPDTFKALREINEEERTSRQATSALNLDCAVLLVSNTTLEARDMPRGVFSASISTHWNKHEFMESLSKVTVIGVDHSNDTAAGSLMYPSTGNTSDEADALPRTLPGFFLNYSCPN